VNHHIREDALVIKVFSKPQKLYGKWFVDILYSSYGRESEGELMFDTEEQASVVTPGYRFEK
jgi:hypothetical protein